MVPFRFNAADHEYIDLATGAVLPHITGMLKACGWIDDLWFTEESSDRGTAVHKLTADFDLGALSVDGCVSPFRGYLLGHVAAMGILQPEILAVEEPLVHPVHRFGGRPDRTLRIRGEVGILEIKTGDPAKSHPIQTAIQAILVAPSFNLPPEMLLRLCLYLKPNGRFKCPPHDNAADFNTAREIIRECCKGVYGDPAVQADRETSAKEAREGGRRSRVEEARREGIEEGQSAIARPLRGHGKRRAMPASRV